MIPPEGGGVAPGINKEDRIRLGLPPKLRQWPDLA